MMRALKTAGVFAGIGGMELGLHRSGHETVLLCEVDDGARAVLRKRFRGVSLEADVREMRSLPAGVELLSAGYPCPGLALAGAPADADGWSAGLIGDVFRLLRRKRVPWVLLENRPVLLRLDRGRVMEAITSTFEALGYAWAYRIVDSRSFGLPQRRKRVVLLASTVADPREVLFADDVGEPCEPGYHGRACGFYWMEGLRGLGWAVDAIPSLRSGTVGGIPAPPGIWMPDGSFVTPEIRDAERLQGFPADWTAPVTELARGSFRWKLVGNAASVAVAEWVGRRLVRPGPLVVAPGTDWDRGQPWPCAAAALDGVRRNYCASHFPLEMVRPPLAQFLQFPPVPFPVRAVAGIVAGLRRQPGDCPAEFLNALAKQFAAERTAMLPALRARFALAG